MSYYTYFYLKPESKYNETTDEEIERNLSKEIDVENAKAVFIADMIKNYYETNSNAKLNNIRFGLNWIIYELKNRAPYEYLKMLREDEDKCLWRNHARSEWDMEQDIINFDDWVNRIIKNLLVLSTIKFTPDSYGDTSKTEMDYLQYEYVNAIEEKLDELVELLDDYTFAKFVTEECTRENEDERYSREHPENTQADDTSSQV